MITRSRPRRAMVFNAVGIFLAAVILAFTIGLALAVVARATPTTPGLPTPPPPLPTQVTNGDGTRYNCTPDYRQCWPAH